MSITERFFSSSSGTIWMTFLAIFPIHPGKIFLKKYGTQISENFYLRYAKLLRDSDNLFCYGVALWQYGFVCFPGRHVETSARFSPLLLQLAILRPWCSEQGQESQERPLISELTGLKPAVTCFDLIVWEPVLERKTVLLLTGTENTPAC